MATYYVDTNADAGGDGTTDATTGEHCAWDTIADVNAASFSAGDSVLFKKGCTWREQLTAPSSGSAGLPITFGAYGSGADPIISGADDVTGLVWTEIPGEITDTGNIVADADDAHYYNTTYTDTSFVNLFGQAGSGAMLGGHVFHGVAVPQAATITAATIKFTAVNPLSGTTCNGRFYGEAADNTAAFTGSAEFLTRSANLTMEYMDWDNVGAWTLNAEYTTPDLSNVIQEITDRVGWESGNNITIFSFDNASSAGAYRQGWGRGAGNTAKLAVLSVTYSGGSTNQWQATVTTEPKQVFFDGVRGTPVASVALVNAAGKWYWASNTLTVYSTSDPSVAFTSLEAGARTLCITASDKSYITIDGLHCTKSDYDGIYFVLSSAVRYNWIVQNSTIDYCFRKGIYATGTDSHNSSGVRIHGNAISECGGYTGGAGGLSCSSGITVGYADDFQIYGNAVSWPNIATGLQSNGMVAKISGAADTGSKIYGNAISGTIQGTDQQNAMDVEGVAYVDIYNNSITASVKRGLWFDATGLGGQDGPTHCKVHHNLIRLGAAGLIAMHIERSLDNDFWSNVIDSTNTTQTHQAVYICLGSSSNRFYNNTLITHDEEEAFKVGDVSDDVGFDQSNCEFKNNIIYHTGTTGTGLIVVDDNNDPHVTMGMVFDYNNYIDPDFTGIVYWFGTLYNSVAAWHAAVAAQEANYVSGDPLFTNAAGGDFTLQAGSPCIDAGTDLGATYQSGLAAGSTWPDGVVLVDQETHEVIP